MTDATHRAEWFAQSVYEQTNIGIRTLKANLAEDEVRSLAKEVLRRVAQRAPEHPALAQRTSHADIERLCMALTSKDDEAATRLIMQIGADGASPDTIYLTFLAGAARLLGEWWDDSRLSFFDVTIATSRIYSIMRGMSHLFVPTEPARIRVASFASVPGETHTLGVSMAADLFRKEGWDIELLVGLGHHDLIAEIAQSRPRLIGLSCSGRHSSVSLAKLIIGLRLSNPGAFIMVSGQVLDEAEDLVLAMDVDGTASAFRGAKATMDSLWDRSINQSSNPRNK
ncbi:cobalamin-dependent protein [Hoeflea sp. AS60]|uniref:cobalamin B12-binding domain-containing protein n=1 Tax=Hoeflea sp. AS60 TaxID=3135780 RepID=UPI0031811709